MRQILITLALRFMRAILSTYWPLVLVAFLFGSSPAGAEERLVRVVWDMGKDQFYVQVEPIDEFSSTESTWHAPPRSARDAINSTDCTLCPFVAKKATILQKGDRVNVYVINYNPVAHVPEKGVVTSVGPCG